MNPDDFTVTKDVNKESPAARDSFRNVGLTKKRFAE